MIFLIKFIYFILTYQLIVKLSITKIKCIVNKITSLVLEVRSRETTKMVYNKTVSSDFECKNLLFFLLGIFFTLNLIYLLSPSSRSKMIVDYHGIERNLSNTLMISKYIDKFLTTKALKLKNFMDEDQILKEAEFDNIFFIETHMNDMKIIENPRQACSVETAGYNFTYFN